MHLGWSNVIVFAPHPDDAEIGCGGLLSMLSLEEVSIHVLTCEPVDRKREAEAGAMTLGIPLAHVSIHYFPQHELPENSQKLLQLMECMRGTWETLVLVPAEGDNHQDHRAVFDAACRAFRGYSILGYEIPRSNWDFSPTVYFPLTEAAVERKVKAVRAHSSQVCKQFMSEEVLRGTLAMRGAQIGVHYAEAYEGVRAIFHA